MLGYTLCKVTARKNRELSSTMIVLTVVFLAYLVLDDHLLGEVGDRYVNTQTITHTGEYSKGVKPHSHMGPFHGPWS